MIIGHTPAPRHAHKFGLPVNGHHLSGHRGDAGVQRQLGQVSAAVSMAAKSEERLSVKKKTLAVRIQVHYLSYGLLRVLIFYT